MSLSKNNGPGEVWDAHYQRKRSRLSYPDENLVRLLVAAEGTDLFPGPVLDFGCGSGRHSLLLAERGWSNVTGLDVSETSVQACRNLVPEGNFSVVPESGRLPFGEGSFSVVIAWGVLHYNNEATRRLIQSEIARVLRPGGLFLGTLRADSETHVQTNADLPDAVVELFDEQRARSTLAEHFSDVELGYMERSPIGDLSRKIAHWFFRCHRPAP